MSARKKPTTSKHRAVPTFRSEAAEREFWATRDSAEYVDWTTARPVRLPGEGKCRLVKPS
ncbi:MAG: hypothetical protein IT361_07275 [Gemmatimonadaceae bacterium]|nr:hypothetical protein [Gemmatimonadaceae bacterium]